MELSPKVKGSKEQWRWPTGKVELEVETVETVEIVPGNGVRSWDLTGVGRYEDNNATGLFILHNWEMIDGIFLAMYCQ